MPAEAAAVARETLGGAVVAAGHLPDQVGLALLEAARTGFVQGMQVGALASAIASVGLAVLTMVLLRNVPAGAGSHQGSECADAEPALEPVGASTQR